MHSFSRLVLSLGLAAAAGPALAQQPAAPSRIRGDIVSIEADTMKVHRNSGETVTIKLAPEAQVSAVRNVPLADVKAGSFVGIAASPSPGGKLRAREVLVFPEAARGSNEGHYEWDLAPDTTMTNANVDAVVQATNGRELTMSYKGGTKVILVPEGVPVVTPAPAARSDLVAGRKVFVIARQADGGTYTTQRLFVEKDGVAPPM